VNIKRWVFIMVFLCFLNVLFADRVLLNNGSEIIGTVITTEGDQVIIRDVNNVVHRLLKINISQVEMSVIGSTNQGPQPVVSYDQEDNNSFSKANFLSIGPSNFISFDGAINPKRDRDYYWFYVEKAGYYKITISGKDTSFRPGIRLINGNNATIRSWVWAEVGDPQTIMDFDQGFLNIGDKICFEVTQHGDNLVADYNLQVSVDFVLDEYEPNNRFKQAKEISENTELRDFIFPVRDRDYYKILIPEAGRLNVIYSHEDVNMRPGIRLINAENATIRSWNFAEDVGQMVTQTYDFSSADEVYLELLNYGDGRRSLLTYLLKTEFIPVRDLYEPNNRFKESKILPMNQSINASIFPRGDRDYFHFVVDQPGVVDLKITVSDSLSRPAFRIISPENATIHSWVVAPEGTNEAELSIELMPDIYRIEVVHYGDNYASLTDYKLTLNLTPSVDLNEPNPSFAQATEIGMNQFVNATIFPRRDRDYYKFWVNNPCDLMVSFTSTGLLRMSTRLINADNATIYSWQVAEDIGKDLDFTAAIKEPGWYYMEVMNHGDARGSVDPYQMILTTK